MLGFTVHSLFWGGGLAPPLVMVCYCENYSKDLGRWGI